MPYFHRKLLTYFEEIPNEIKNLFSYENDFVFTDKNFDGNTDQAFWDREKNNWTALPYLKINSDPSYFKDGKGILNPNFKIFENRMPHLIVIDDFYQNIETVIEEINAGKKFFCKNFYSLIGDINGENWIEDFFSNIIGHEIEIEKNESFIKKDFKIHSKGNKRSHSDWPKADYIALIYTKDNKDGGTELVEIDGEREISAFVDDKEEFFDDGKTISPYYLIEEKFNRLVIYNAMLFHREKNIYDGRTLKRYFLKSKLER